jgi:hypothetical protein
MPAGVRFFRFAVRLGDEPLQQTKEQRNEANGDQRNEESSKATACGGGSVGDGDQSHAGYDHQDQTADDQPASGLGRVSAEIRRFFRVHVLQQPFPTGGFRTSDP